MATTKNDISRWFDKGVAGKQDFMIVVCDTFDYDDYPIFTSTADFNEQYQKHNGVNMQRVMEEKLKVWFVRNGEEDGKNDKRLLICFREPKRYPDGELVLQTWETAPLDYLPEIKNGECFEAEITLGRKL